MVASVVLGSNLSAASPLRSCLHDRPWSHLLTAEGCDLSWSPEDSRTAGRRLAGRGLRAALTGRPRTPPIKNGSSVSRVEGV